MALAWKRCVSMHKLLWNIWIVFKHIFLSKQLDPLFHHRQNHNLMTGQFWKKKKQTHLLVDKNKFLFIIGASEGGRHCFGRWEAEEEILHFFDFPGLISLWRPIKELITSMSSVNLHCVSSMHLYGALAWEKRPKFAGNKRNTS